MSLKSVGFSDLDLISGAEALEIFGVKHKSQLRRMVKTYEIPHKKLSIGRVFLRSDIEAVQNSSRRQSNLDRMSGKKPRKIIPNDIQFCVPVNIENIDLIAVTDAIKILGIKHSQDFGLIVERYEIPHTKVGGSYIFFRPDIENVKNSPRRIRNVRRRHGQADEE